MKVPCAVVQREGLLFPFLKLYIGTISHLKILEKFKLQSKGGSYFFALNQGHSTITTFFFSFFLVTEAYSENSPDILNCYLIRQKLVCFQYSSLLWRFFLSVSVWLFWQTYLIVSRRVSEVEFVLGPQIPQGECLDVIGRLAGQRVRNCKISSTAPTKQNWLTLKFINIY